MSAERCQLGSLKTKYPLSKRVQEDGKEFGRAKDKQAETKSGPMKQKEDKLSRRSLPVAKLSAN